MLADPWDCFDTKQVFSRPAELVAAHALATPFVGPGPGGEFAAAAP